MFEYLPCSLEKEVQVKWYDQAYQIHVNNIPRYAVYENQAQYVRNMEAFLVYYKKNPKGLLRLYENTMKATFKSNADIQKMFACRSNLDYRLPYILRLDTNGKRVGYPVPIPWPMALEFILRWLQGLIVESFGAQGLTHIKEVRERVKANAYTEIGLDLFEVR